MVFDGHACAATGSDAVRMLVAGAGTATPRLLVLLGLRACRVGARRLGAGRLGGSSISEIEHAATETETEDDAESDMVLDLDLNAWMDENSPRSESR